MPPQRVAKLLGFLAVNTLHNCVHLATGIVALAVAMGSTGAIRMFFRVFGVIYALVAILGFVAGDTPLLGLVANNRADAVLHVAIAIVTLWIGFGTTSQTNVKNGVRVAELL